MLDVPVADALDEANGVLLRALGLRPELFLGQVVALREPGHVLLGLGAEQSACLPLAGKRAVEAPERLHPDEIAQDEHVERDLEAQLRLDLRGRVRGLPRLVVLDDRPRAERVDVDAVDLPRQRKAVDLQPALELGRRAVGAERDLELARHEAERDSASSRTNCSRSRQRLSSSSRR